MSDEETAFRIYEAARAMVSAWAMLGNTPQTVGNLAACMCGIAVASGAEPKERAEALSGLNDTMQQSMATWLRAQPPVN